jgi:hypothetical protein
MDRYETKAVTKNCDNLCQVYPGDDAEVGKKCGDYIIKFGKGIC